MSITITVTGLTSQQQQDIGNAFDTCFQGRGALSKAQWVQLCLIRHIKGVVSGWKRQAHETALVGEFAQIDLDYPEA